MTREEAIQMCMEIKHYLTQGNPIWDKDKVGEAIEMAIEALERERADEWCTDCKEYDTEKKCCPRFNRVIRGAMKREPSEDLISRAEAIEHFMRLSEDESLSIITQTLMVGVSNELKKLPSADRPRGEWVPCSERLPSEGGKYLVFYTSTIIGSGIEIMRYGEPLMPNVDVSGKHFYRSDGEWGDIVYDEVIAWMPLPEAIRRKEQNNGKKCILHRRRKAHTGEPY